MMRKSFLAIAIVPALIWGEVIFSVDFNNHPQGPYTKAMAQTDFPGASWYSGMDQGWGEIVQGREGRGNALRMLYPAGKYGPNESAIQIKARFPDGKAVDAAWASYWLKFEDGFDFVKGGKLPGLCGNQCITGGNDANGYNGWSARIMWRGEGVATQYMYYVTNEGYGEDILFNKVPPQKRFIPGKWHRVNTQIIMNTPGIADGIIRTWFDGELSMERDNILIRHIDTLKITEFYISTFFGGSDATWAPSDDMYITYDDFAVITAAGSSPEPQVLYKLSETSGYVPITVTADLTASQNISINGFAVDFGNGVSAPAERGFASFNYTIPGIYNIRASVQNGKGQRDEHGRLFFALGERDLLSNSLWARMPLGDTLRNGDTLRIYLTVVDTAARIIAGPVNTSEPGNLTQPQEALFYGVFQYQNGIFSACDGSPCTYISAPGAYGIGTYELEFVLHGTATALNTYSLNVYDAHGSLMHQWENLARRGYAQSGQISNYATWASRDQAALAHMDLQEHSTAILPKKVSGNMRMHSTGDVIILENLLPNARVEVYNLQGKRIYSGNSGNSKILRIPVQTRGVYIVRVGI